MWNRDDYPPFTFLSHTYPKARKEHTCKLCKQVIEVGTRYDRYVGILDGEFFSDNRHTCCLLDDYCIHFPRTIADIEEEKERMREEWTT